jgi:benzoyl-CoA reductase/2-hydroxyglutaryl-CoA dehydratase subunit BcrC/BadD/HgdB
LRLNRLLHRQSDRAEKLRFRDPEAFDYPIPEKESEAMHIPPSHIEVERQMHSPERIWTRVRSFAEMPA